MLQTINNFLRRRKKWEDYPKKDSYEFGITFDDVVLFKGPQSPEDIQFYLDCIAQRWREGWRPWYPELLSVAALADAVDKHCRGEVD